MITLKVEAAKAGFLDRKAVIDAIGKTKARFFGKAGAKVRSTAQKSLVYSESVSAPGGPPHAHKSGSRTRTSRSTGKRRTRRVSLLREFTFFAFDRSSQSVVVGPARLGGTVDPDAPKALEYGGMADVLDRGKRERVRIRRRPYMGPALAKVEPELPAMWRDSVR